MQKWERSSLSFLFNYQSLSKYYCPLRKAGRKGRFSFDLTCIRWQIWSHHFSVHLVLHSPHTSWLNLAVLNPTAPCCITANLYLSPPAWRTDLPRRLRTISAPPGLSCSNWSSSRCRLQLTGCHGCKQRTCSLHFLCERFPRPSVHPLNNSQTRGTLPGKHDVHAFMTAFYACVHVCLCTHACVCS